VMCGLCGATVTLGGELAADEPHQEPGTAARGLASPRLGPQQRGLDLRRPQRPDTHQT
jgi:hypothetical protein